MTDPANSPKTSSDQSRGLSVCRLRKTALLSSRTKKNYSCTRSGANGRPSPSSRQADCRSSPQQAQGLDKIQVALAHVGLAKVVASHVVAPTVCRSSLPSRRLKAASASAICLGGFGQRRIKSRPVGKSQAKSRASKRLLLDKLLKK